MNGPGFAHHVTQPWFNDSPFYLYLLFPLDVPEREGPNIHGTSHPSMQPASPTVAQP